MQARRRNEKGMDYAEEKRLYAEANKALEREDYAEEGQLLARIIELYPEGGAPAIIYGQHGASLLRNHEFEKAIKRCDRSIRLDPNRAYPHTYRGTALGFLFGNGKDCFEEARASLRRAHSLRSRLRGH